MSSSIAFQAASSLVVYVGVCTSIKRMSICHPGGFELDWWGELQLESKSRFAIGGDSPSNMPFFPVVWGMESAPRNCVLSLTTPVLSPLKF
jgi:hypothetical protein